MSRTHFFSSLLCCLLTAAAEGADSSAALALVRKLDSIRLPAASFVVDVKASELLHDKAPRELGFRVYAKETERVFVTLMTIQKPADDENKLILVKGTKVWFFDPRSRNATVLSAKQLWQHSFAADSVTVRLEDQYDAMITGNETIDTLDSGKKTCAVLELAPKAKRVNTAESVRYWVSTEGRPYQSAYIAASGKTIRSCQFGGYANVLGASRPTRFAVQDPNGSSTFVFSSFKASSLPDSIFDPDNLPRLRMTTDSAR